MATSEPIRRIATGAGICGTACLLAMFSYHAAGWEWLDAAYMVVITVFGVGYGEVRPLSDPYLKIQTIALIVVGCLSGLYSCGGFIQLLTEGEIKRALGAQKMSRGIKKMNNHSIVCGFGRVGRMLAEELKNEGVPCVIIDNDQSRLDSAEAAGLSVVRGDASCDETLERAGIARAKTLACVLPNDAINVFITLTARDLNPFVEIIARAECPSTEHKLIRSGADHVVMPATISAIRMAEIIKSVPDATHSPLDPSLPTEFQVCKISVRDAVELESLTLAAARELLADVGTIIGVQHGSQEICTKLDSELQLWGEDVVLLAKSTGQPS